jgi:hypothetical protein
MEEMMRQPYLIEKKKTAAAQRKATAETFGSKPEDERLQCHPIDYNHSETRPASTLMREIRHEVNRAVG